MALVFIDIRDIVSGLTYRINPNMVVRLNPYLNRHCEPEANEVEILLPVAPGNIRVKGTLQEWEKTLIAASNPSYINPAE